MEEKNKENSKYQIIANYVKDLSFEIPSPDCFVDAAQNLGKYETKVDISNKPLKNGMLELNCKLIFEAPKEVQYLYSQNYHSFKVILFKVILD